jgi:prepilin-type N-terminal cleavage/methylation domain-containing protein
MPKTSATASADRRAPSSGRRSAFTFLELVLVVAIIGIVSALAYGSLHSQLPRYRLVKAANELAKDVAELRMTAINTNLETRFLVESLDSSISDPNSWGGAWRLQAGNASSNSSRWEDLPVDAVKDGSDDETGMGSVDIGQGGNRESRGVGFDVQQTISGPSFGNNDAVVFTPRGWVANPADDFDSGGYITLRLVNKLALAKGIEEEIHVRIARSGYVRLESSLGGHADTHTVGTSGSSTHGT